MRHTHQGLGGLLAGTSTCCGRIAWLKLFVDLHVVQVCAATRVAMTRQMATQWRDVVLGADDAKHLNETGVRIKVHSQWLHALGPRWLIVQSHECGAGQLARDPPRLPDPRSLEALGVQDTSCFPARAVRTSAITSYASRSRKRSCLSSSHWCLTHKLIARCPSSHSLLQ